MKTVYTIMPVPEEVMTSTDLDEAIRIAADRAQRKGTAYGVYANLNPHGAGQGFCSDEPIPDELLAAEGECLKQLACRDPLTGLYDLRHLHQVLSREYKRAVRDTQPLSCALIDVDDLGTVNDTYGHLAGDTLLRGIGGILSRRLRETDCICRYGEDEYCILLPNTDCCQAQHLMEKLKGQIAEHRFSLNDTAISITISFGIGSIPH